MKLDYSSHLRSSIIIILYCLRIKLKNTTEFGSKIPAGGFELGFSAWNTTRKSNKKA